MEKSYYLEEKYGNRRKEGVEGGENQKRLVAGRVLGWELRVAMRERFGVRKGSTAFGWMMRAA